MEYKWGRTIKWIPGWEGTYAVTIDGKVASYACGNAAHGKRIWMSQSWQGSKGKKYLSVNFCKDGKQKWRPVHQLVLETFVGPRPPGMKALHKDDNPVRNHLDNLYWGTRKQNAADAKRNGRMPWCKLTEQDVWRIHELRDQGWIHRTIADQLGIARETVRDILRGRTWSEVHAKFLASKTMA